MTRLNSRLLGVSLAAIVLSVTNTHLTQPTN